MNFGVGFSGGEADDELEAQIHIWKHMFNFINSIVLNCVVELSIPDAIHEYGEPMSLSALASTLHINPTKVQALGRLMRILTQSGFFYIKKFITQNDNEEEGLNSLVDVGGGNGTMTKAIADAYPQLSCICFDLPHVIDGIQETANMTFVSGDMFKEIPQVDAILLKVLS
ncbi:hypothetical protein Nepgr_009118 [Nepenthes gracilis]|uniref:O-methyltransferase C-terminal domain-containing protein n=1 Tax=Nepenthes gracilis TaxID=150966 RepID=A0AAD3S9S1_NEPGR|nr:hypothetical protein Nepgr_009118 [Nepenthes gracilis]